MSNTASNEIVVVIGPGQIGQAIARRVGFGKHVLLAEKRQESANAAAEVLANAGYDVTVKTVDVSSREDVRALLDTATALGRVTRLITPPVSHPRRHHPRPSLRSIFTARRWCWRRLAM
jgi:NAD(P)-dependent dehydrogenase (short-subunit alcohol dehydrogenase family)